MKITRRVKPVVHRRREPQRGVGAALEGARRLVGAEQIVGVDINPARKAIAEKFGMTHFVNPKEVEGDLVPYLVNLTKGGADYSFECVGNTTLMRQALECAHRGWGVSTIIGVAASGQEISTRPFQLVTRRKRRSTSPQPVDDYTSKPYYTEEYRANMYKANSAGPRTASRSPCTPAVKQLVHAATGA